MSALYYNFRATFLSFVSDNLPGGYQFMVIMVIMVMKLELCVKGTSQIHWLLSQILFVKLGTGDEICCLKCNLCRMLCCLTNV